MSQSNIASNIIVIWKIIGKISYVAECINSLKDIEADNNSGDYYPKKK